jgi:hypothetical protein
MSPRQRLPNRRTSETFEQAIASPVYEHQHVVTAPIIRIVPDRDGGGWLVVTPRGSGWLHGSRQAALEDKAWLDAQCRSPARGTS